jgi:hypothetical protein
VLAIITIFDTASVAASISVRWRWKSTVKEIRRANTVAVVGVMNRPIEMFDQTGAHLIEYGDTLFM